MTTLRSIILTLMSKVFDSILSWEGGSANKKYLVSPRSVLDFFTQGIHLLRIPDYQRPYSWSKKNINDLLSDVHKLSLKDSDSSWFLGPIFTVKKSSEDQFADLLDGQQRITTIQIILREASLIRQEFEGLDLSENHELNNRIDKVIEACKKCLVRMVDGFKEIPVFETEESIKELFKSYILDFNSIKDYDQLKNKRKQFEDKLVQARIDGSITAGTISEAISIIRGFIKNNFISNGRPVGQNMESFFDYMNALINKCWLIEIPLQNHNDSIQIFESLNNRGKSLTLVDKLRYKSIVSCSKENVNQVRLKWKDVYSGLNRMIDEKFVKSEDDFFKVFFNSIKGDDFTKEEDFIDLFADNYLISDESILMFLEETISICHFHEILTTSLDSKNQFVNNNFQPKETEKVKALFQLFKQGLNISDNSRFLLYFLIRNHSNFNIHNYIIVQGIWIIVRYILHEEIYKNKKSNTIRTEYLDRVKTWSKNKEKGNKLLNASEIKQFNFNKSLNFLIKTVNNNEAKFVLYFYAYISDFDSLTSHNPNQYKKSHLDHFFPRAWKGSWSEKAYELKEVMEYLDSLHSTKVELFKEIDFEQFKLDIKNSENFILLDYSTSPAYQEDSVIEFIGNKWVLHAGTNIRTSNNDFDFKKGEYQNPKWTKVPANDDLVGIDSYNDLTYKEIMERTLVISNKIIKNFYFEWDSF